MDQNAEADPAAAEPPSQDAARRGRLWPLSIAALGIVYGDIGTSPLYAMRECFHGAHATVVSEANVLGVLSLIFWSLVLVVSIKYLAYVLRADHGGEGGILALTTLAVPSREKGSERTRLVFLFMGLFGSALLYGDGMITPAISVLSAVEGLKVVAPSMENLVIPLTVVILVILFAIQRRGTAGVGVIFGPVTFIWFLTIGAIGFSQIVQNPQVLRALDPSWGVRFFVENGFTGFVVLGAVFLVVTGAEAIYADLGHFGTRPIRVTWFTVVLPGLLLNYLGQGALVLRDPSAAEDLFFRAAPGWAQIPLIILATMATVIASQAVISGAYSLTRQAVMMGFLPRFRVEHTSAEEMGQIYVPGINWALMVATIAMVLAFGSSSRLAAAYGIAVTSTMAVTTVLAFRVARRRWKWSLLAALVPTTVFLILDLAFFGSNLLKIANGGWVPLVLALGILIVMSTWKRGRAVLAERMSEKTVTLSDFMPRLRRDPEAAAPYRDAEDRSQIITRVPGTAVYMSSTPDVVPLALAYTIKHHHVVHERVVILNIRTDDTPHVDLAERAFIEPLGAGVWRVTGTYGFMEHPDVPVLLQYIATLEPRLEINIQEATFLLGHETILSTSRAGMSRWREHLFALMSRNATRATRFFGLPADRVVEMGAYIEM